TRDGHIWLHEADLNLSEREATVLEHRGVRCHVSAFDLLAAFPPQPDDVDEFGILGEQLSERLHVMPIPVIAERANHILDVLSLVIHSPHLLSFWMAHPYG